MNSRKKKPFSARQKKKQIQDKRAAARKHNDNNNNNNSSDEDVKESDAVTKPKPKKHSNRTSAPLQMIKEYNGLKTVFAREPDDIVEERKKRSHDPIEFLEDWRRENIRPQRVLGMPKRPMWEKTMNKQQLEKAEEKEFSDFITNVYKDCGDGELNFFEHNLGVWRQLWRAIEMADVLLLCCDVRWPSFTFPYALADYAKEINKPVVLTMTKADLVPQEVGKQWEEYFQVLFPHIVVATTNAYPNTTDFGDTELRIKAKKKQRAKALKSNPECKKRILDACKKAVDWKGGEGEEKFFTISAVGAPNAGKSAVINMLVESHKVAVSETPGKTKHFQTHFINHECRLLDSPGLTFPVASKDCRTLQCIVGNYPISQMREPFSAVAFLMRRIDIPRTYGLVFPYAEEDDSEERDDNHKWSAYEVCEALAMKRGFTLKGGNMDVYRSGKAILKEALRGYLKHMYWLPNKIE